MQTCQSWALLATSNTKGLTTWVMMVGKTNTAGLYHCKSLLPKSKLPWSMSRHILQTHFCLLNKHACVHILETRLSNLRKFLEETNVRKTIWKSKWSYIWYKVYILKIPSLCYQYIRILKLKRCYLSCCWFSALSSAQTKKIDYSVAVLFIGTYLHSMRLQSVTKLSHNSFSLVLEWLFFFVM